MFSAACPLLMALLFLFNPRNTDAQCQARPTVTVKGRLLCFGVSIAGTSIVLEHRIGFMDNLIGFAKTEQDGSFSVTGVPHYLPDGRRPILSIRVEYSHISSKADFRVRQGDDIAVDSSSSVADIGDVEVDSSACNAYTSFYIATLDYYNRVGQRNPTRFFIQSSQTQTSFPYVRYTEVIYDGIFEWTASVAKHELAHVIRHYYDGDGAHFESDESKYGSSQLIGHDCSTDSSEGFAFNEGWALYWENACLDSDAQGSHAIEGNVAAALRALQDSCSSSASQMWHVLEGNPGEIHSFGEYESKHRELFACP